METFLPLPGLDRLVEVCRHQGLSLELPPSSGSVPRAGELLFGYPLDPMVAAVYQRLENATLGDFFIFSSHRFLASNKAKEQEEEPFRSCVLFGGVPNLAYYYGTVPAMADARGLQPVVFVDGHETQYAVPLASNVDRFFSTYARYLELAAVKNADARDTSPPWDVPAISFPYGVPELIAEDVPLMALVRAGRFDFLTNDHAEAHQWLQKLVDARGG